MAMSALIQGKAEGQSVEIASVKGDANDDFSDDNNELVNDEFVNDGDDVESASDAITTTHDSVNKRRKVAELADSGALRAEMDGNRRRYWYSEVETKSPHRRLP